MAGFGADDTADLLACRSAGFPGVTFLIRGVGEEFADRWLRVFRNGKVVFKAGPFDDQLELALRDI